MSVCDRQAGPGAAEVASRFVTRLLNKMADRQDSTAWQSRRHGSVVIIRGPELALFMI
jgi:hypothetical protein